MKTTFLCAVIAAVALLSANAFSQVKSMTETEVQNAFDKAMRTYDGKLLRSVLRKVEADHLTDAVCTTFLKTFVKPWYEGDSIQRLENGKFAKLNSSECKLIVMFKPKGGYGYGVVEKRPRIFVGSTIKEGKGYKIRVSLAQIVVAYAYVKANSPKRNGLEEMQDAEKIFEGWVPLLKKIGTTGSVDPEKSSFDSWDEIVKVSRAQVKEILKKYGKGGGGA